LTHIGGKIYPEWEQEWLMDPQKIKPGTFMPTFGFTEAEATAIATYLDSLK
jgi:nitric oxide reductase subunit C